MEGSAKEEKGNLRTRNGMKTNLSAIQARDTESEETIDTTKGTGGEARGDTRFRDKEEARTERSGGDSIKIEVGSRPPDRSLALLR